MDEGGLYYGPHRVLLVAHGGRTIAEGSAIRLRLGTPEG